MIRNFRDHAANERTFLAWVRTAIAVMAFGFVIARIDILVTATNLSFKALPLQSYTKGTFIGISSTVVGATMFVFSIVRFAMNKKNIDRDETIPNANLTPDFALAVLLTLIGISSFLYLLHLLNSIS